MILPHATEILFFLSQLEDSFYYRKISGHVFSEIASQKFSGNTAIQQNVIETRENLKKTN